MLQKELIIETILRYKNKFNYEITTNGILLDENILKLFKDYDVKVIISFDGPEKIHNKLRMGARHEKLMEIFDLIHNIGMQSNIKINCTYTSIHEEYLDKNDLEKYLSKLGFEYTINNVITENKSLKLKKTITNNKFLIEQDIDLLMRNKRKSINKYLADIIVSLIERNKNQFFCQDAEETLFFDTKCRKRFCNATLDMSFSEEEKIASINRKNNFYCNNCWAKFICSYCPVKIFKNKQNFDNCNLKRNCEYAMERILEVYLDDVEKFENILGNYIYYE